MLEHGFVNGLKQAGAKFYMYLKSAINNDFCDVVFVHTVSFRKDAKTAKIANNFP